MILIYLSQNLHLLLKSKSNLDKLFDKHYLPLVKFCLENGYSINESSLFYVTEINTIIQP